MNFACLLRCSECSQRMVNDSYVSFANAVDIFQNRNRHDFNKCAALVFCCSCSAMLACKVCDDTSVMPFFFKSTLFP